MRFWPKAFPHPALVFVVLAWGLNFSVIKVILAEIQPSVAALVRYLVMLPILLLATRLMKIPLKYPEGQRWRYLFAGFIANGVYMVFFLEGMRTAGATQGAIVIATMPIWIAIFAIMAGQEKVAKHMAVGSLLCFVGVVVVILGNGGQVEGSVGGALLVLVSAVIWGWSVSLMRPLVVQGSPYGVFALTLPGGLAALLPYGAYATWKTDWAAVAPNVWLPMAYLTIVAGAMAFSAYFKGLADVGPARTSMVQYFIAPVAALCAWALFAEPISPVQFVGMAIVVAGSVIASGSLFGPAATSSQSGT